MSQGHPSGRGISLGSNLYIFILFYSYYLFAYLFVHISLFPSYDEAQITL
jgi:hypothetical protein